VLGIQISPDNRVFYGQENSRYLELLEFEDSFEVNSSIVFVVSSQTGLLDDLNFRSAISFLEERASSIEGVTRAVSLSSVPYVVDSDGELDVVQFLKHFCDDICSTEARESLADHRYVGRFVSHDGLWSAVYAVIEVDVDDPLAVSEADASARKLLEEALTRYPKLKFGVTGAVPMMQAFVDTSAADSSETVSIALVVVLVLLCVFLGGHVGILVFLTGALSALSAVGLAGLMNWKLNTATSIVPLVVFTLVVAGAMHLAVHFLHRISDGEPSLKKGLIASYYAQFPPMMLAMITTCLSLLSLLSVTSPPIRELGVLTAFGVFLGTLLCFTFLGPTLLLGNRVPNDSQARVRSALNWYAKYGASRKTLPTLSLILILGSAGGVFFLEIDDDFVRYFGEEVQFRKDAEQFVNAAVSSPYHLEVLLENTDDSNAESIFAPPLFEYITKLTQDLRVREEVLNVSSIHDVMADAASVLDYENQTLTSEAISQIYLSYELSLPVGQSTTQFIDLSREIIRTSVILRDVSSNETKTLEAWLYDHYQENGPDGFRLRVTGENIPVAHLSLQNIKEMLYGLGGAVLIVCVLFALIARRVSFFFYGLMAIAAPIAAGFGAWGLTQGALGLSGSIILAVTVGVVIDDAIHLMYRFRDAMESMDLSPSEAASYAIHKVGPAIFTTSVCLISGFLMLLFSGYSVNQHFGVVASLIFGFAILFDLIVLPKLLASDLSIVSSQGGAN